MTYFTVCCGYASHYHNTVTVEADTLDEALEKAIEQASDDPHWKSVDQASQTFVDAVAEGEEADPWSGTAIPIPDRFTEKGEPPVVTPAGLRPPGGIDVAGGTVRFRFIAHAGTVTTEVTDPPAPPGNKPLVTVARRADGAPDVAVSGDRARVLILDPAIPDRRRPVDRRRHSSIAIRLPCATPGRGPSFGSARTASVRLHPGHRYSRGPFHETVHRRTAHEAACKWAPKGRRPQARGQVVQCWRDRHLAAVGARSRIPGRMWIRPG